jgi:class 3 adenylate cyclase
VLFVDVCGSTTLYEKLGDRAALDAIDVVVNLAKRTVGSFAGRVVKTTGDGIMAVFSGPDSAVQAASDLQTRVSALAPIGGTQLAIRIGLHAGAVLESSGDYYGDAVNVAARMAEFANGGQIIITAQTAQALSPLLRHCTRNVALLAVKGKRAEMQVCEVVWQAGDDVTTLATRAAPHPVESVLLVTHGALLLEVDADLPMVTIGREAGHHIVVADMMASRLHGRIERRGDKFYYVDLSTNGTYIRLDGDTETVLRRDQMLLRGQGTICCGHSGSDPGAAVVGFMLEPRVGSG